MASAEENLQSLRNLIDRVSDESVRSQMTSHIERLEQLLATDPQAAYNQILEEIHACTACELHKGCTQKVPGEGSIRARIMFIGEGPGAQEDKLGRPFVGRAGQLLDRIIEAAGWKREEIYITNTVRCRPPNNRTPNQTEIDTCDAFTQRLIELIDPEVILCWGSPSSKMHIDPEIRITREHGKSIMKGGRLYVALYHPAYIMRQGGDRLKRCKKQVWDAIQDVQKYLEANARPA